MYDDAYDCYSDQYTAQDDYSLVETFQPPPSRKSKRLPTPVVTSKIGGNRLPQIPQSTGGSDFGQRKRLPSIVKTSASSSQFYDDQTPYGGYDDSYSDSNYYQSTIATSATTATSDYSTKYVSPYSSYSSYMPTASTTTTTTTISFTHFNNQAISTTAIASNSYSDHSYTNSIATKLSNNIQPKSVLSSILPLTTSSSSQMHNTSYGYGIGSTIMTVTTAVTTQSSGLGINTITKTLSSIFQSKPPATQPKTQEQSSLKFQLPNFTAKLSTPTTTTTTSSSSVHNNDYDNNYCDDAYYNSTLTTATTPVTSVTTGGVDGGTTIASNIYNNIHQLSETNDYPYDDKMATTMVDYSKDDYKYNYDDFSYSENDYIATGDITNNVQNNYNNNYDDYADDGGQMIDDINHLHHQQTNDNVTNNKNFYCDSSSNSLLINQDKTGGMHHLNQEHVAKNQSGHTTTSSNGDYGVTMTTTSASSIGELLFCGYIEDILKSISFFRRQSSLHGHNLIGYTHVKWSLKTKWLR